MNFLCTIIFYPEPLKWLFRTTVGQSPPWEGGGKNRKGRIFKNAFKKSFLFIFLVLLPLSAHTQELFFFTEGTDATYYDQGLVNVGSLNGSSFEHTYPPGFPEFNDKVPCSTMAFEGSTSLKFNYISASSGNWQASINRPGWAVADLTGLDSVSFYLYSETGLPATALPLIGLRAVSKSNTSDVNSNFILLSTYNTEVPAGEWVRIKAPLAPLMSDDENSELDFTQVKAVVFNQSETDNSSRLILIDQIAAFKSVENVPAVKSLTAIGYDSHAELNWEQPAEDLTYQVLASYNQGSTWELRGETTDNYYLDFVPESARNSTATYRVVTVLQGKESAPAQTETSIRDFSDDELMDMVQRYAFNYFWDGAHQATGMILERSNGSGATAASGATGMGLMAMIVAHEREYRPREVVKDRLLKILAFLENCERHHGAWSHWYNADTYQTQPFSSDDDGGDIVETSFVAQGLIALRNYFNGSDASSVEIRETADRLWKDIDWDWYRNGGQNVLYWHWSPNFDFQKNMKVSGWNEALITYIMAASSPTHGIPKAVYDNGWARNGNMINKRTYYSYEINLSPNWGGPLFWIHYTHLGINPHGLKDQYADYWEENLNTAQIHYAYAMDNPLGYLNYGENCWGLTASDDPYGYTAHKPMDNDNGTISPTAALASMPYTPDASMRALKYFYRERGADIFGKYGPFDAFNDDLDWISGSYLGIDQGPIVVMLENHRTGLLWKNVMKDADVQSGLEELGFQYNPNAIFDNLSDAEELIIYPNPASGEVHLSLQGINHYQPMGIKVYSIDGRLLLRRSVTKINDSYTLNCSGFSPGTYLLEVNNGSHRYVAKLLIIR